MYSLTLCRCFFFKVTGLSDVYGEAIHHLSLRFAISELTIVEGPIMRISVVIALVVCIAFAAADVISFSEVKAGTEFAYTAGQPLPPGEPTDALTFYTDRVVFETAFPGLIYEDYSGTIVPGNSVQSDTGPFDYLCNNSCFTPGDIVEGIVLDNLTTPANDLVVLTPPFLGVTEVVCGPNTFASDTYFEFTVPVNAFGIDIVMPMASGNVDIEIFGTGGSLGTTSASGGMPGNFWGVYCDTEYIIRVEFIEPVTNGELFTRALFGEFVPLERNTWGEIKTLF